MVKGVRVPEKAFGIAMWAVSAILAAFIVGLGNLVIGDLPQVEQQAEKERRKMAFFRYCMSCGTPGGEVAQAKS